MLHTSAVELFSRAEATRPSDKMILEMGDSDVRGILKLAERFSVFESGF
jgi:hypothetical protein